MLVKICGIMTEEAAAAAVKAGADFIGFVFADSKRQISPAKAAELATFIPASIKKVGVFVNEDPRVMQEIVNEVRLDFIQLHGDEPPDVARSLSAGIIKAFPAEKEILKEAGEYPSDYILVDTPSKTVRGGSGQTFNWDILDGLEIKEKLILAGGLTSDNVGQAIERVQPIAVDVSSGVETEGKKDAEKMKQFIKRAKEREDLEDDNIHDAGFAR